MICDSIASYTRDLMKIKIEEKLNKSQLQQRIIQSAKTNNIDTSDIENLMDGTDWIFKKENNNLNPDKIYVKRLNECRIEFGKRQIK